MVRLVVIGLLIAACEPSLTPVAPPPQPGGTIAVQFTVEFPAGQWDLGDHGYRLEIHCPKLGADIEPPVARFVVESGQGVFEDRVWLRFDGLSTAPLSPSNLTTISPAQSTGAVVTLTGLTESEAGLAIDDCEANVVYDGLKPVPLIAGEPFIP